MRYHSGTPSGYSSDTRPVYSRTDTLFSDTAVINREFVPADYILVQHSHPDHVMVVPYLAVRTGAVVIGHESTINIMSMTSATTSQRKSDGASRAPNVYRTEWVDAFAADVRAAVPNSRVIIPKHLEPIPYSRR